MHRGIAWVWLFAAACSGTKDGSRGPLFAIVGGAEFTCSSDPAGVSCWGDDRDGELSPSQSLDDYFVAHSVPSSAFGVAVALAAGDRHVCAATQTGTITCWGSNDAGQRGR